VQLVFAGFSFVSYVTYRAAAQCKHAMLITVAPAVHHYNYAEFPPAPAPWIVVQGDDDEVVPLQSVLDFVERVIPPVSLVRFPETGHFFHGKLIVLKEHIMDMVRAQIGLR
jgi:alpha/beta superfamily hydrolase